MNSRWILVEDDKNRTPESIYKYTYNPLYLSKIVDGVEKHNWEIVTNYQQFVSLLESIIADGDRIGVVSFDHDLADEHLNIPCEIWETYTADQLGIEETGLDCAKYLAEYVNYYKMPYPTILVHSMNPVGKERIQQFWMDFLDGEGACEDCEPFEDERQSMREHKEYNETGYSEPEDE